MISRIGHMGIFNFKIKRNKKIIHEEILKNMISNDALDEISSSLLGSTPDVQIKYIAFGDDNTALDGSQNKLESEMYRSPVVDLYRSDVGIISSEFLIGKTITFSGLVYEIGIFCGSTCSATANSGLMLCRLLPSTVQEKISGDEWFFQRIDTLANVN